MDRLACAFVLLLSMSMSMDRLALIDVDVGVSVERLSIDGLWYSQSMFDGVVRGVVWAIGLYWPCRVPLFCLLVMIECFLKASECF